MTSQHIYIVTFHADDSDEAWDIGAFINAADAQTFAYEHAQAARRLHITGSVYVSDNRQGTYEDIDADEPADAYAYIDGVGNLACYSREPVDRMTSFVTEHAERIVV